MDYKKLRHYIHCLENIAKELDKEIDKNYSDELFDIRAALLKVIMLLSFENVLQGMEDYEKNKRKRKPKK